MNPFSQMSVYDLEVMLRAHGASLSINLSYTGRWELFLSNLKGYCRTGITSSQVPLYLAIAKAIETAITEGWWRE